MGRHRLACLYLACQSLLVAIWWLALWLRPGLRGYFVMAPDWPESTLLAFALPDVVVIVAGSALSALGIHHQRPWARSLLLLTAGGVFYATLWCLGTNVVTGSGWLCTAMMLASALGTGWALHSTAR